MKKFRKIFCMTIMIITLLLIKNNVHAVDSSSSPLNLGLHELGNVRKTGAYSYRTERGDYKPAYKIQKYENSNGIGTYDYAMPIYCLKNGVGFGSRINTRIVPYTQVYNMNRPDLINNIAKANFNVSDENYNKIVWILNNVADVNNDTSINSLLEQSGVTRAQFIGDKNQMTRQELKDILEIIQQMAIWQFTNDSEYKPSGANIIVRINNRQISVKDKYYNNTSYTPIDNLFAHLINGANRAVSNGYTYQNSNDGAINFNTDSVVSNLNGENYVIGPYSLNINGNAQLKINAYNGNTFISNLRVVDGNYREVSGNSFEEKVMNNGGDFYIVVPKSTSIDDLRIIVSGTTEITSLSYWTTSPNTITIKQPEVV